MPVRGEVLPILRELLPEKCRGIDLHEQVRLVGDLGLNSLDIIRLISALEQHYDIDVFTSNVRPEEYETIGALERLVQARVK